MSPSQAKAVAKYRDRLADKGMARFEVLGRKADRMLIRDVARAIAENDEKNAAFREFAEKISNKREVARNSFAEALLRSPLVGSGLDLTRSTDDFRTIEF